MTNISKKSISQKQLNKLFTQLSQLLAKSTVATANSILTDLLGHEERVMLAKRLAAIIMLSQGHSQYRTAKVLKISTSTTAKLSADLRLGHYRNLTSTLKKDTHVVVELLEALDDILHLGGILPHYNGQDRYKNIRL